MEAVESEVPVASKVPWFKNAIVFAVLAVLVGAGIALAEAWLLMRNVEDGLPEPVSAGLFALVGALTAIASMCVSFRTKDAEK